LIRSFSADDFLCERMVDARGRGAALRVVAMLEGSVARVISAERFGGDFSASPA
jgi:hypothetical protein